MLAPNLRPELVRERLVRSMLAGAPRAAVEAAGPDDPMMLWLAGDKSVGDVRQAQAKAATRRAAADAREKMRALRERLGGGGSR